MNTSPEPSISQGKASAVIRPRLQALKALSLAELATLPAWTTEEARVVGQSVDVTTYRDSLPHGGVQIVVQLSTCGQPFLKIFRSRQVFAEGFRVDGGGEVHDLAEKELYEFI